MALPPSRLRLSMLLLLLHRGNLGGGLEIWALALRLWIWVRPL